MSWLFGLNKNPAGIPDAIQVPVSGGEGGGEGGQGGPAPISTGSEGYRSEAYSFDSTALERAAKAAKVCIRIQDEEKKAWDKKSFITDSDVLKAFDMDNVLT